MDDDAFAWISWWCDVAKEDDVHSDEEDERGRAGVEAIVGSGEAWVSL